MKLYHRFLVGLRNLTGLLSAKLYIAADEARDKADKALAAVYHAEINAVNALEASLQERRDAAAAKLNLALEDLNRAHYGR